MPYDVNIVSDQNQPVFMVDDSWNIRITNNEDGSNVYIWNIRVRRIDKLVSFWDDDENKMLCCRKAKKYVGNKEGVKLLLKHQGLSFQVMLYSGYPESAPTPPTPPTPAPSVIPAHFIAEFMEMSLQLKREHSCPCCFDVVTKDTIHLTTCGHILCKSCYQQVKQTNPVCPTCRQKV